MGKTLHQWLFQCIKSINDVYISWNDNIFFKVSNFNNENIDIFTKKEICSENPAYPHCSVSQLFASHLAINPVPIFTIQKLINRKDTYI